MASSTLSLPAPPAVSARDAVCRGRARGVVCHCRGAATRPAVFALAVLFAVVGLTGATWSGAATQAAAQVPASAPAHSPARSH